MQLPGGRPWRVADLNDAGYAEFVAILGPVFEHSPWVAELAAARRPFADRVTLFDALVAVLDEAPPAWRLALIAAHPDLAGRAAREGRLTPASRGEQTSAGLTGLSPSDAAQLDRLNTAYRAKFGFPFVICARGQNKGSILGALEERTLHDRESEIATALREIERIAWLRLRDLVSED